MSALVRGSNKVLLVVEQAGAVRWVIAMLQAWR
jgi:hypothetical protein